MRRGASSSSRIGISIGVVAQFLAQTVDAIWARVERSRWRSDAERERFKVAVDSARAVYARLAGR